MSPGTHEGREGMEGKGGRKEGVFDMIIGKFPRLGVACTHTSK